VRSICGAPGVENTQRSLAKAAGGVHARRRYFDRCERRRYGQANDAGGDDNHDV